MAAGKGSELRLIWSGRFQIINDYKYIRGKPAPEVVGALLDFVQMAFPYGYDDEEWGCDRAFFSEETLFYPSSDCEDHAILFSRLVRDLVGLNVVLVYYPGHLATAVHFPETIPGDYLELDGKRFVICDPTYLEAPIGRTMSGMDNKKTKVILLDLSVGETIRDMK